MRIFFLRILTNPHKRPPQMERQGGEEMKYEQMTIEEKACKETKRERFIDRMIALIAFLVSIMALIVRVLK